MCEHVDVQGPSVHLYAASELNKRAHAATVFTWFFSGDKFKRKPWTLSAFRLLVLVFFSLLFYSFIFALFPRDGCLRTVEVARLSMEG